MKITGLAAIAGVLFLNAAQVLASDINLSSGDSITIDGNRVTCDLGGRPDRSWSCAISCRISGFQDASDVVRPMAASAAGAGSALDSAVQRCAAFEQSYVDAFKVQHPTWPIYITWKALCNGQDASISGCCAED